MISKDLPVFESSAYNWSPVSLMLSLSAYNEMSISYSVCLYYKFTNPVTPKRPFKQPNKQIIYSFCYVFSS